MSVMDFFAMHPVFTSAEFAEYQKSNGSGNQWTQKALLAHHRKQGRIEMVRHGLYVVVQRGRPAVSPFLLAVKLADGAALAYHTALEAQGTAYSEFNKAYYLARRQKPVFVYRDVEYKCALSPKTLREKGKETYGMTFIDHMGVNVPVTSLERTMVDVLDRPDLCGGWEEVWRSLEMVEYFGLDIVLEYALMLGNATTIAKTGYFLEQHREKLMVEEKHLKLLEKHIPRKPHYLDRSKRKSGILFARWNLIVPEYIKDRSWEQAR